MRRLLTTLLALGTLLAPVAPAARAASSRADHVDLIQVDGTLDTVMADFVHRTLATADGDVVIQLNSGRGVLSTSQLARLVAEVRDPARKVGVWVGPARAGRAGGQAVAVFNAAPVRGVAPGASVDGGVPAGISRAPTLGDFLVDAMGEPSTVVNRPGRPPQRQPAIPVLFAKPTLVARLLHASVSPGVPYALALVGGLLVLFEFFTVGIGLAAFTGMLAMAFAAYGFGALPTRPGGLALLAVGVFGLAIDLQAGAPRAWTVIGAVALVTGSLTLYAGVAVPVVAIVVVLIATALFVGAAMPAVIRARFSTPTIGRETMLGEMGVARSAVDPDGTVEVRGAPWRARTNRATPIPSGAPLRVVGIDGLVLEVEPESGGARDSHH